MDLIKREKNNVYKLRKQPPRPINEISVREGVPSWKMPMCSKHRGLLENCMCSRTDLVSWKILGVRELDRASWKMSICSMRK